MRKYTINTFPKQWYILADTDEKDAILVDYYNKTFKQDLGKSLSDGWYFLSEKIKNHNTGADEYYLAIQNPVPSGFEEITIDEFKKYVLNEEFETFINEDHNSLIRLLKEIKN